MPDEPTVQQRLTAQGATVAQGQVTKGNQTMSMLNKCTSTLSAGSLLLAASMLSPAAADPARIDKMSFSASDTISKIHIISTDGKKRG